MNNSQAFPNPHRTDQTGMSLREYAAIKLKVPDSGADWLDDMIRQSIRDDFAAKAMQGMMHDVSQPVGEVIAEWAYQVADAMLKARKA